ncbi:hypothetical protein SUGI_0302520 [Cryptomeria japonica]|uniref:uncharacterized protein LOC131042321 n=1 Tax=Cryptomeria japonica TaxID=3369 RepID=UPI002408E9A3|nr:uncharacterized protein LOC131042321 [Cryptomeria japonica]GLJ17403.1 hypothetical protein SUGI_0302520 [Cryptomeria japonica]
MATMTASASLQFIIVFFMASFSMIFCQAVENPVGGICNNSTDNSTVCQGTKGLKISHIVEEEPEPITSPGETSPSTPTTTGGTPKTAGSSPTIIIAGSSANSKSMASTFIVARPSFQAVALVFTVTSFLFFVFSV